MEKSNWCRCVLVMALVSGAVGGCTEMRSRVMAAGVDGEEYVTDDMYYESENAACVSGDEECMLADDYLTGSFLQTEQTGRRVSARDAEDVIAFSQPAGRGAVSVKRKQKAVARQVMADEPPEVVVTEDKILYTTQAIPETVEATEEFVATAEDADVVTGKEVAPALASEISETDRDTTVTIDETATTTTTETTAIPANMMPLKKVTTTITETTTKIKRDPTAAREFANMTLAERIQYGEEVQDWEAVPGNTLRGLLMDWGNRSGWTVVWKLDRDYHLEAGVVFRGTFTDVASALIRSFARATPAPIGTFYQGNRVLVINTQEDENER